LSIDTPVTDELRLLVGFCEKDQAWYKIVDDPNNPDSRLHHSCGSRPSTKIGYQVTTQRTFNPKAKKLSKAAQKRMGIGA
jgi:hypothetical protein